MRPIQYYIGILLVLEYAYCLPLAGQVKDKVARALGYNKPKPAHDITPTPPSFATAEAKPESEIPTPIPPCITGVFISIFPIKNDFICFILL